MHSVMDMRSNANLTLTNNALKDPEPEESEVSDVWEVFKCGAAGILWHGDTGRPKRLLETKGAAATLASSTVIFFVFQCYCFNRRLTVKKKKKIIQKNWKARWRVLLFLNKSRRIEGECNAVTIWLHFFDLFIWHSVFVQSDEAGFVGQAKIQQPPQLLECQVNWAKISQ